MTNTQDGSFLGWWQYKSSMTGILGEPSDQRIDRHVNSSPSMGGYGHNMDIWPFQTHVDMNCPDTCHICGTWKVTHSSKSTKNQQARHSENHHMLWNQTTLNLTDHLKGWPLRTTYALNLKVCYSQVFFVPPLLLHFITSMSTPLPILQGSTVWESLIYASYTNMSWSKVQHTNDMPYCL